MASPSRCTNRRRPSGAVRVNNSSAWSIATSCRSRISGCAAPASTRNDISRHPSASAIPASAEHQLDATNDDGTTPITASTARSSRYKRCFQSSPTPIPSRRSGNCGSSILPGQAALPLAFKSQGSRVLGCVLGRRPAGYHVTSLTECEAGCSRLLHGCYTSRQRSPEHRCSPPETEGLARQRPD
jgi:hypothetical protein